MPTPEERHIRKTVLWERIDRNNQIIQRKSDEIMTQVKYIGEELSSKMRGFGQLVSKYKDEFNTQYQNNMVDTVKKIESLINKAIDEFDELNLKYRTNIEKMLDDFKDETDNAIQNEVESRLSSYENSSKSVSKDVKKYYKDIIEQMGKFQNETLGKYNDMRIKVNKLHIEFEKVLKKKK